STERYRFREALGELMNVARLGNKYLADEEPWKQLKENPERVQTVMYVALQIAAALGVLSEPFLPFTAEKLRNMLLLPKPEKGVAWEAVATAEEQLASGHRIAKAELLFSKIEDTEIERQLQRLEKTK